MIHIIDDWYVTVETNPINYTVKRGTGKKDSKGRCKDKVYGYYNSLQNAIKAIRREIVADKFSTDSRTLCEAFQTIREIDARFEKIMEKLTV